MLEILFGGFLIALGFCVIYFSTDAKMSDSKLSMYMLLGIAAIIGGAWIILTRITLTVLLIKAAGLILALVGFFMVFKFPDVSDYQSGNMARTGVFLGIIVFILGIYLLFFY